MDNYKGARLQPTNLKLTLHPLLVLLPVLLLYLLIILNGLDKFRLDQCGLFITIPPKKSWRSENGATATQKKKVMQGDADTDLLLLYLCFPRSTTLALKRLDPPLESCAEGTCLVDEFFQLLSVACGGSIVHVVERPRM